MRKVLPISIAILLAVAGCTTNRTPGNGQPVTTTPAMSPASTPGTSSGNVPMSSAYLTPSVDRLAADEAAAIMREHQARQGRFLGWLNPTPRMQQPAPVTTGAQYPPSLYANPQVTVNASISSDATPVVTGGGGGGTDTGAVTGAFVLPGTTVAGATAATGTAVTAASTIGATTGATAATTGATTPVAAATNVTPSIAAAANVGLTPTSGATTATPGMFAQTNFNGLNPSMASAANTRAVATTGAVTTANGQVLGTTTATTPITAQSTVNTSTTASRTVNLASRTSAGLVIRPSNATASPITITNVGGQIRITNARIR